MKRKTTKGYWHYVYICGACKYILKPYEHHRRYEPCIHCGEERLEKAIARKVTTTIRYGLFNLLSKRIVTWEMK